VDGFMPERVAAHKRNAGTESRYTRSIEAKQKGTAMRSILLWAVGLPIPLIIILWLVTGHA
jgi:hypothetical protein